MLVAVNKVDKPGADIQRVSNELMKYDLLMEEYGGAWGTSIRSVE